MGFGACSPPEVDRIWLRVNYNTIPIYPSFIYLKGSDSEFRVPRLDFGLGASILRFPQYRDNGII